MASSLIELEEARRIVLECARTLDGEDVELEDALGRVLAEEILAADAVPSFDNSAMDGFAIRADDVRGAERDAPASLELVGESRAGLPRRLQWGPDRRSRSRPAR